MDDTGTTVLRTGRIVFIPVGRLVGEVALLDEVERVLDDLSQYGQKRPEHENRKES